MNHAAALATTSIRIGGLSLEDIVRDAVASFHEHDLAYLALTSKPEGPLRDRIALRIRKHIATSGEKLLVGREFANRVDLAVVVRTCIARRA
jgi:hypothetical protein